MQSNAKSHVGLASLGKRRNLGSGKETFMGLFPVKTSPDLGTECLGHIPTPIRRHACHRTCSRDGSAKVG